MYMSDLNPSQLHVRYLDGYENKESLVTPRCYTLTHSDTTGELFLTIGRTFNQKQVSGIYTRLMRDEVLAEWKVNMEKPSLYVHCHVSGGVVIGNAHWRYNIFKQHMRMVLEAFYYGDLELIQRLPELDQAPVQVHFHARQKRLNKVEDYGVFSNYQVMLDKS